MRKLLHLLSPLLFAAGALAQSGGGSTAEQFVLLASVSGSCQASQVGYYGG